MDSQPATDAQRNTTAFPTAVIILYLWRFKWLLLVAAAILGSATYAFMLTRPEYFKSTINCVPPKTDQSSLGNIMGGVSSTLKDIGLSKLGGSKGETYDFIVILYSRSLRDSMIKAFDLVKEYEMEGERFQAVRDEFDDNVDVAVRPEGNYEITVWSRDPQKAVKMCSSFVAMANEVANRVARDEAARATIYLERRIATMDSTMNVLSARIGGFSKEYLLFSPTDQAKSAASALADLRGNILKQETILGLLEQTYGKDDPQAKTQRLMLGEMRDQLQQAMQQPGFAGNFAITNAAGLSVEYLRLVAELEAMTKVKALLVPTLEQTRLDVQRTAPSLLVIDPPVPAEKRDRPKRLLSAVGAGIGIDILIILVLLAVRGWREVVATVRRA